MTPVSTFEWSRGALVYVPKYKLNPSFFTFLFFPLFFCLALLLHSHNQRGYIPIHSKHNLDASSLWLSSQLYTQL